MSLGDFPVDDTTLAMLSWALNPQPPSDRTSLQEFLVMMSQIGGSRTERYEPTDFSHDAIPVFRVRDPQYTEHDLIRALVAEIWRLRKLHAAQDHD